MDILCNLLNSIMSFEVLKVEEPNKRIKRIDVIAYALNLVDYMSESIDALDREFLFMGKFAIDYLLNNPLLELSNETSEDKKQCNIKMQELKEKNQQIRYEAKINNFEEFIKYLYFPLVLTDKFALEVLSRKDCYENSDDLYRMMQLAVARPNDRLLRHYNRHYKAIKLEYIKMIASIISQEIDKYDIELNEADRQLLQLCKMINNYLQMNKDSSYYDTAKCYLTNSMGVMLKKCDKSNE